MPSSRPLFRQRLRQKLQRLDDAMFKHASPSQPTLVAMSAIGAACMLLYYPVWKYALPQPYESLALRLAGCAVLLPLALLHWWPRRLRALLPAYWYGVVTFVLPFFAGYMLLRNGGSTPWLLIHLASIYLTMMMFDLTSFLGIFALGSVLAWIAWLVGPHAAMPVAPLLLYLPLLAMALALGPLASLSQKHADLARIQALTRASNNIAHELRTPLGSLQIAGQAFRRYLPDLVAGHRLAQDAGLPVVALRGAHLEALERGMDTIEHEVAHAHTVIDMLLMAARPLDPQQLDRLQARALVRTALERYPYASRAEQERVHLRGEDDFPLLGSETLLMHVIFNLLRNALFHTGRAGKGEIDVQVERGQGSGRIVVRDTGPGIPPDVLPRIFNRFYSYSEDGAGVAGLGIGLAFSREAVERMGGDIQCRSRWGAFTEFVISFPSRETDARA
ncbi:HAMP domain-containing sensor histidine kinase [Dyella sp.]|jgi:two-component system CAI-1 autoinducer sensor kinase/phosphatase CqsS|uniref:sensor histidine kinase n=1 Tax=Dyella sp. TaxID=1869338 RepID=UPI002D79EFDB|nr:HAMP domain-containing sensor histidine kinase [Dyella sp.]HET6430976.1 HAMP domain-containing sensor histidine kinase [Dyella sp.]